MIAEAQLQAVTERISSAYLDDALITQLRAEFAPLHFTYCYDDDISGRTPAIETDTFNLYLIDGREHCLKMTDDYEAATGIVVAEVIADD
ncbi:MAG: DUF6129 family protein [Methylococcales bacterium]|jgi:hypothetical protein|nr:DUF6129 family protein [Methylococcales bacterium]